MKVKSILAAAFVLISSVIFANGVDDTKLAVIRGQESGSFKVIFAGNAQVSATVNVLDSQGNIVYTKEITGGFLLPMNFTGLRSGEYTIEVQDGSNTWTKSIYYSRYEVRSNITKAKKSSTIQYVHISKLKNDGKYLLSVVKTGNEVVTVDIFNANNDLIHSEKRKTDGNLGVVYDVKKFSGASKFQITDNAGYSTVIKK